MAKVNANVELSNSFVVGGISVAAASLCWVYSSNYGEVLTALKKFSAWGTFLFSNDKTPETFSAESKSDATDSSSPQKYSQISSSFSLISQYDPVKDDPYITYLRFHHNSVNSSS